MPFVRPRVEIFQEFKNVVVSPVAAELKTCLVGPCFDIQDYVTNKDNLEIGDFIKAGVPNPPLCNSDGSSSGRPDVGAFMTLSEPPAFRAGSVLDPTSVHCYFDNAYIEIARGTSGAIALESNVLTVDSGVDLTNIVAGDRVVMHRASDATVPVVNYVKSVDAANSKIYLTSIRKASDQLNDSGNLWRIEHKLNDQLVETLELSFAGNTITISVPASYVTLVYKDTNYYVNSAKMYLEYRALRTDLSSLITVNTINEISSKLGIIDERNPLAVAAYVALSNTNTEIYAFGVKSDNLAGQTAARDYLSSNEDIYAIVPLTDSMDSATWLSVINMWKQNCEALAQPEKSKFRVVIGSFHEIPTYKDSATPSTVGSTTADPSDPVDVLVCASADFADVTSQHYLDVVGTSYTTFGSESATIFEEDHAAKSLRGMIGSKRIRINGNFGSSEISQTADYFVRPAILASEGGVTVLSDVTATADKNVSNQLTFTATAFKNKVQVGDILQVKSATDTDITKEGYYVNAVDNNTGTVTLKFTTEASISGTAVVDIYRPPYHTTGTFKAGYIEVTNIPSGVAVGDILIAFRYSDESPPGQNSNAGLFRIQSISLAYNRIYVKTYRSLVVGGDPPPVFGFAFYKGVATGGDETVYLRRRLIYLRDNTATFTSTVEAGEYIEIPYPANAPGLLWDTTTNKWPIAEVVADQILRAQLTDLQELAPKNYVAGFSGDCPYRIAIGLDKDKQVTELNSRIASLKSMRLVMCWPHEVYVSGVSNNQTKAQNKLRGQYLAAAVGGQISGNPPHQGFTYIPISAVTQLFGSSFYFTDDQLTTLRNGGWYVFVQDNELAAPYSIHEVTTDVSAYEFGELMHVKDFDYIAKNYKVVLEAFKGRYNITPDTIEMIKAAIVHRSEYLKNQRVARLGAPLLDATLGLVAQTEADRLEIYQEVRIPHVLNQIGLHLQV